MKSRFLAAVATAMLSLGLGYAPPAQAVDIPAVESSVTVKTSTGTATLQQDGLVLKTDYVCAPDAIFCEHEPDAERDVASALPYWALGHQFEGRTVCLESTRALAPLSSVRNDAIAATNNLLQFTPETTAGGCTSRGYPASQQIKFISYSSATDGHCGFARTWTLSGLVHHAEIHINENAAVASCRTAVYWPSVWNHEVGHSSGLAHVPATENSVMPSVINGKRLTPEVDGPRLINLYTGNPLFGNGV